MCALYIRSTDLCACRSRLLYRSLCNTCVRISDISLCLQELHGLSEGQSVQPSATSAMERMILQTLDWELHTVTPLCMLLPFLFLANPSLADVGEEASALPHMLWYKCCASIIQALPGTISSRVSSLPMFVRWECIWFFECLTNPSDVELLMLRPPMHGCLIANHTRLVTILVVGFARAYTRILQRSYGSLCNGAVQSRPTTSKVRLVHDRCCFGVECAGQWRTPMGGAFTNADDNGWTGSGTMTRVSWLDPITLRVLCIHGFLIRLRCKELIVGATLWSDEPVKRRKDWSTCDVYDMQETVLECKSATRLFFEKERRVEAVRMCSQRRLF